MSVPGRGRGLLAWVGSLHPVWPATVIALLGVAVPLASGWWMAVSISVFLTAVAVAATGTESEVRRLTAETAASEQAARETLDKVVRDGMRTTTAIINPASVRLRNMVEGPNPGRQIEGLRQNIVEALVRVGPAGSRSAVYLFDGDGRLRRATFSSHHEIPRTEFYPEEPDGQQVYALIAQGNSLLFEDITEDTRVTPRGDYKSVVAVSLGTDTHRFGMLTLDAPQAGTLTTEHQHTAKMLAQILVVGELLAKTRPWLPGDLLSRTVAPMSNTEAEGKGRPS